MAKLLRTVSRERDVEMWVSKNGANFEQKPHNYRTKLERIVRF